MAKTFNGNIWGRIGDVALREEMLRRERNEKTLNTLADAAKFFEKTNANRKLKRDWQDYFRNRANSDIGDAEDVDNALLLESLVNDGNGGGIFDVGEVPEREEASIWDPSMIADGYSIGDDDAEFMANFDPATASPEEIRRAQEIIGTDPDGVWGPKSRLALKNWRG